MLPFLVVLFIVVPIAELAIIIQVGQEIGVLATVAVLVLDSILGSLLMRSQGRAAWRRFTEATSAGRPPAGEVIDGALVLLGGAFLLTPGFISDLFGLALLLPPSRAVIRGFLARRMLHRMTASMTQFPQNPGPPSGRTRPKTSDVEGTAVEVDPPGLPG